MRIRGLIAFASVVQVILFLTHFFIYKTWMFAAPGKQIAATWFQVTVGLLSLSFLSASLLAFRFTNRAVRTLYRIAAVWLGIVSFLFFAAGASWVVFGVTRLAGVDLNFHVIVEVLYVAAVLRDRKSTRLNSSHLGISYAVFCLKKKKRISNRTLQMI